MNIKRFIKISPFIYIAIILFGWFYVRYIFNNESLPIDKKDKEEKVVKEVKIVEVTLVVEGLANDLVFEKKMKSTDTFDEMLEDLRGNQQLYFEKTDFTYGTEYHDINRVKVSEEYVWKVYAGGEDITFKTKNVFLQDGWIYRLVLSQR